MERFSLQFRDRPVQSVLQRGQSKFVQLSFEPGQGLTKHKAPLALSVIVLSGQIRFTVEEKVEVLNALDMLAVDPAVEHAVEAIEKSIVLLVLTPDAEAPEQPAAAAPKALEHENAYQNPALLEQIAPELRPLVEDHIEVCKVLEAVVKKSGDIDAVRAALRTVGTELDSHFVIEEQALFPRMAIHVGGTDVGPVARLIEEHAHIRALHAEAKKLLAAWEQQQDQHVATLVQAKLSDLAAALLNHLGKEDSHLFPMASRLLTADEKQFVAKALADHAQTPLA